MCDQVFLRDQFAKADRCAGCTSFGRSQAFLPKANYKHKKKPETCIIYNMRCAFHSYFVLLAVSSKLLLLEILPGLSYR